MESLPVNGVPSGLRAEPAKIVNSTPGRFGLVTTVLKLELTWTSDSTSTSGRVMGESRSLRTPSIKFTDTASIAKTPRLASLPLTISCCLPEGIPVIVKYPLLLENPVWPVALRVTLTLARALIGAYSLSLGDRNIVHSDHFDR